MQVELRLHREELDCRGSGLVLVPSVMTAHGCSVLTEPPAQPTIFYPAQGVTETWARDPGSSAAALGALLGPARAGILLAAHAPSARRRRWHRMPGSRSRRRRTISACSAGSGLVASRRDGAKVLHLRTPLGEAVVGAVL